MEAAFFPGRGRVAIKTAVQAAGIDGEPTLLLLEEHHMRENGLAVLASAIVSRGELPGLFTAEELDGLIAPLADVARREDFSGTLEQYLYHRTCNISTVFPRYKLIHASLLSRNYLTRKINRFERSDFNET